MSLQKYSLPGKRLRSAEDSCTNAVLKPDYRIDRTVFDVGMPAIRLVIKNRIVNIQPSFRGSELLNT
jgi:hypothetical protein